MSDIVLRLKIDGKEFNATVKDSDELIKKLKQDASDVGKELSTWSQIATGFNQALQIGQQAWGLMKDYIAAYVEEERAVKKLEIALGGVNKERIRTE